MLNLGKEFDGRAVLVTGADGFLGSHMCDKLVGYGADVTAFVRAASSGQLTNIVHLRDKVRIFRGDLTDPTSVKGALKLLKGEDDAIIFHLGAQAHVGESWERPYETVAVNVLGTLNILQGIVDLGLEISKMDTAGTSEEFGGEKEGRRHQYDYDEHGHLMLHELSPINPKSVYATSKVAADFLTTNYHEAYGVPGVVTRMFNNYGPRQNPRYVTGTIITQALSRKEVHLGNLAPKRDFCYIEDGVRGHMHVALKGKAGEVYCYGYGKNISMHDWVGLILGIGKEEGYWGDLKVLTRKERYRPGSSDVMELRVGYRKLEEETGWKPLVSWEDGIRKTIEWYAGNREKWIGRVDWL